MNPVNQTIKGARARLGLCDTDVAVRAGLSIHEYCDIESYQDEAFTVVHLSHLKKLCEVLGLDLLDLFEIDCAFCQSQVPLAIEPQVLRSELIGNRRVAMRLSQDQLGDLIGFKTVAIVDMEKDPDYLERWSVELIVELAGHLEVPPQVLLGVRCKKCGR